MSVETTTTKQFTEILSDVLKPDCSSPCSQSSDCGSAGDCGDKDYKVPAARRPGFWQTMFVKGLENTINIAFDEVRKEPQKILMIGGCRQRDFARHIALLLPAADITLIDPIQEEADSAKADICCRFKFIAAPIEAMPFDDEQFDLVIAHNMHESAHQWEAVQSEIQRIVSRQQGNVMLSVLNPTAMALFGWLPGFKSGLKATGVSLDVPKQSSARIKQTYKKHAVLGLEINPMPWQWLVFSFNAR